VFIPLDDPEGRTFSQMSDADKHAVSHRGRAFAGLVEALRLMEPGQA
jgi:inosine/xanthosine triphosphate pyrophosphatase family protein